MRFILAFRKKVFSRTTIRRERIRFAPPGAECGFRGSGRHDSAPMYCADSGAAVAVEHDAGRVSRRPRARSCASQGGFPWRAPTGRPGPSARCPSRGTPCSMHMDPMGTSRSRAVRDRREGIAARCSGNWAVMACSDSACFASGVLDAALEFGPRSHRGPEPIPRRCRVPFFPSAARGSSHVISTFSCFGAAKIGDSAIRRARKAFRWRGIR